MITSSGYASEGATSAMPWETRSQAAGTQRNVGVLEAKMRHRLQQDADAVAIGALATKQKKARPRNLPQLARQRPPSFEAARAAVMDALALPSPTRALVQRHVVHAKHERAAHDAQLPPVAGAFKKKKPNAKTQFPIAYQRGELPVMLEARPGGQALRWTQPLASLELATLLPLCVEGLREPGFPFQFMAREGALQLVQFGHQHPEKLLDCLPRVVPALRALLELREPRALRDALLVLQKMAAVAGVGPALVPYYRQLLPVLNVFKAKRRNMGDAMDFQQRQDEAQLVLDTLELLERTGGADAFVNIKYMVPTYEGVRPG